MAKTMRKKNLKIQMLAGNSSNSFLNSKSEENSTLGRSSLKKLPDGGRDSLRTLLIQKCTDDAVILFAIFLMKQLYLIFFDLKTR